MIKEKYDWVKEQLTKHKKLRDSNEGLYYQFLLKSGYDTSKSIKEFLQDMSKRKIPYIDSFGRASRKVQEDHAHLRGDKYHLRKGEKEPEIRQEIRDLS